VQATIEKWHTAKEYLVISNRQTYETIKISHIFYIEKEKQKNYILIHSRSHTYRYRSTISGLEGTLQANDFVKINASQLINMKYIEKLENNSVVLGTGVALTISRQCATVLKNKYKHYLRDREI